jgi:hypothetical protein
MAESNHAKEIPLVTAADDTDDTSVPYEPKDAIAQSVRSATFTGSAGLLLAAVQNTLARENVGAFGVFSRFGGTIALFGTYPGANLLLSMVLMNVQLQWVVHMLSSAQRRQICGKRTTHITRAWEGSLPELWSA